jgi:hypothetical protein
MKTVSYIGALPDGTVQDPNTGRVFGFKRGASISVPDEVAAALVTQDPESWSVQVTETVNSKSKGEK